MTGKKAVNLEPPSRRPIKMLKVICEKCDKPLKVPGAILFGPPSVITGLCEKMHFCLDCYYKIKDFIFPPIPF